MKYCRLQINGSIEDKWAKCYRFNNFQMQRTNLNWLRTKYCCKFILNFLSYSLKFSILLYSKWNEQHKNQDKKMKHLFYYLNETERNRIKSYTFLWFDTNIQKVLRKLRNQFKERKKIKSKSVRVNTVDFWNFSDNGYTRKRNRPTGCRAMMYTYNIKY